MLSGGVNAIHDPVYLLPSVQYINSSNVSNCQRDILDPRQLNRSPKANSKNARTPTPAITLLPMSEPG